MAIVNPITVTVNPEDSKTSSVGPHNYEGRNVRITVGLTGYRVEAKCAYVCATTQDSVTTVVQVPYGVLPDIIEALQVMLHHLNNAHISKDHA